MANILSVLTRLEGAILVFTLLSMILLAVVQIFLRNVFDTGFIYSESMVRILVLWVTMIGAMIASRQDKHIRLEVLIHYIPENWQHIAKFTTELFATIVCFTVCYFSYQFVLQEYHDGGKVFLNVPNWVCESIIPFAFLILASRYLFSSLLHLKTVAKIETL